MFKKIIGTAGSKIIIAAISLLIMFFNAHYLGATGVGTIGLIVLGITIILLVNNFIGGTTLVYLVPREDNYKLLFISYVWALVVALVFWLLMLFIQLVPDGYKHHVVILSLFCSVSNINLYILLGKEKIRQYNVLTTIQYLLQLMAMVYFFLYLKQCTVMAFIYTLYFSYLFIFLTSNMLIYRMIKRTNLSDLMNVLKRILRLGSLVQTAFVIQMMNYRLGYYIIDYFIGRSGLGMFHFANQLAEGTWIVGKSVSIVQYSKISNSSDKEYAKRLTLRLMKLTFLITLVMILVFFVIPDEVYIFFGKDFGSTRWIIVALSVGILANGVSMMFSHYFAGLGKPQVNTVGSSIGLVFTLALGFWLIPVFGLMGAGITASVSYLSALVFQVIMFIRIARPSLKEFNFSKEDYTMIRDEIMNFLGKKQEPADEVVYREPF
ncbi:MAG: polysaccharide biosynthesis C-terminal domain-containing protein [Bacteroidetes bacterium]|nr:polysaccharide biosynthesis C-terminal domain-containing protein [Bacteroidota bacterium]